jgi:hypothetical protein
MGAIDDWAWEHVARWTQRGVELPIGAHPRPAHSRSRGLATDERGLRLA